MDRKQKRSMRWVLYVALFAAVCLAAALIFGQNAFDAEPPSSEERTEAIDQSGFSDAERDGIKALVHDYIVQNPEVITEGLEELRRRETVARLEEAGGGINEPFANAYLGKRNAPITLVEFTDYNCGFCRQSVNDIMKLTRENDDLRVVFREAPILNAQSRTAALWALAAAEQGRYEQFHNMMFEAGRPTDDNILAAARLAGMDIDKARQQIRKPEYAAELDANIEKMRTIGAGGTPTFVIGGQLIEGAVGYDTLQKAVERERES